MGFHSGYVQYRPWDLLAKLHSGQMHDINDGELAEIRQRIDQTFEKKVHNVFTGIATVYVCQAKPGREDHRVRIHWADTRSALDC